MAIKNIITLGIGASPGNIKYFLLLGLDISAVTGIVDLTLPPRSIALTLDERASALTLPPRTTALTLRDDR